MADYHYNGHGAAVLHIDEASMSTRQRLDAMGMVTRHMPKPTYRQRTIDVYCPYCGVDAGVTCLAIRRHINWFGSSHVERMHAAQAVEEALKALKPDS